MKLHSYACLFQKAALDHLVQRTDIDTSRIVVFGRSLGGAVGSVLTKNNPDKVLEQKKSVYFVKFLSNLYSLLVLLAPPD